MISGDVAEGLREVAELRFAARGRTPRRAGRRRCAARAGARTAPRASSRRPDQRVVVGEPEAAGEEGALVRRQAVDRAVVRRRVARTKPSSQQLALDRRDRADARAGRPPAGSRRAGSAAALASSSVRAVGLGEGAALGVVARARRPRRGSASRSARQRLERRRRGRSARVGLTRAVDRDPGHHLGVGEVAARAAHLPDALVGLAPVRLDERRAARAASAQTLGRRRSSPARRAW